MSISERDYEVLSKIIRYCEEIRLTHERFSNSYESFINDFVYRNAIAMCVLQIGELTVHLSEPLKEKYNQLPWQAIKSMRNFVAHRYGKIDPDLLWQTTQVRIPELMDYCLSIQCTQKATVQ